MPGDRLKTPLSVSSSLRCRGISHAGSSLKRKKKKKERNEKRLCVCIWFARTLNRVCEQEIQKHEDPRLTSANTYICRFQERDLANIRTDEREKMKILRFSARNARFYVEAATENKNLVELIKLAGEISTPEFRLRSYQNPVQANRILLNQKSC